MFLSGAPGGYVAPSYDLYITLGESVSIQAIRIYGPNRLYGGAAGPVRTGGESFHASAINQRVDFRNRCVTSISKVGAKKEYSGRLGVGRYVIFNKRNETSDLSTSPF
ncbi:hypothetical protein EVAR_16739_1 [Eumeta japonica]|uniref:Uncharacterized protein n=1 Tax=Eumeta variegata TaxID=151549 RepID=A0A4C1UM73_EUMVA|nr:hypothetical protein EVAR_16739_1 [Eumeta japonica]